jgi:hypothetical protein
METSNLPPSADDFVPAWPCSRRGLPGRVYYYTRRWSFTPPFHPDPAFADRAVCFLWPFSGRLAPNGGVPAPGAIRRRALWSADFPRSRLAKPRSPDQPDTLSSYPIHLHQVNNIPAVSNLLRILLIGSQSVHIKKGCPTLQEYSNTFDIIRPND